MIETALISGLFFMALLPIYDLGRAWYVQSNLQYATRSAARLLTVGANRNLTRQQAVATLMQEASGLDLSAAQVTVASRALCGSGSGTGAAGELVTLTATVRVPLVTPFLQPFFRRGMYNAQAAATFLNEVAPAGA